MISVRSLRHRAILNIKNQRILTELTHFQILSKIFKSKFPGNRIKLFIFPDSASFTESVRIFGN